MNLLASNPDGKQVLSSDFENDEYPIDNFDDVDLVSNCADILQAPPRSYVGEKRPRNLFDSPTFGGKRPRNNKKMPVEQDPMTKPNFTDNTHNKQPPLPTFGAKRPRYLHHNQSERPASCHRCEEYILTIRRQQEEIAQLKAQGI